jgi:hypothetical protein
MGRIFIAAGRQSASEQQIHLLNLQQDDLDDVLDDAVLNLTAAKEMLVARDLIVQTLRSRNYEVLPVPDDLEVEQIVQWINRYARRGDVALEIQVNPLQEAGLRGAGVYYIAKNEARKTQAEQLLQAYLRRVPQQSSRGAKPDTFTHLGLIQFCRWVNVPSLVLEVGSITHPGDRQILQSHRQEMAFGIAEGLAMWSRSLVTLSTIEAASASGNAELSNANENAEIRLTLNGANCDDRGALVDGNVYIPVDLIDQLGVALPSDQSIRRIEYHHRVLVRAIDLRELNLCIRPHEKEAHTWAIRSAFFVSANPFDRIMGQGLTSEVQMIMFLKSNHAEQFNHFSDLPKLYREEATLEGVNHDLAFAQCCLETNFLRSGNPLLEHHNYGGLGAGNGQANFSSPRVGVRAHIQHLKAYGSTEPLVQAIVDPRFSSIRRGVAPHLSQLSGRWSADLNYHKKLLSVLRRLYESAGFL